MRDLPRLAELPAFVLPDGRAVARRNRMWFGQADRHADLRALIEHGGYTGAEIVAHLHNKIAFARRARGRAGTIWGRVQNWAAGEDPAYVSVPGSLMTALLLMLGEDEIPDLADDSEAKLRLDVAETLLGAASAAAEVKAW